MITIVTLGTASVESDGAQVGLEFGHIIIFVRMVNVPLHEVHIATIALGCEVQSICISPLFHGLSKNLNLFILSRLPHMVACGGHVGLVIVQC